MHKKQLRRNEKITNANQVETRDNLHISTKLGRIIRWEKLFISIQVFSLFYIKSVRLPISGLFSQQIELFLSQIMWNTASV